MTKKNEHYSKADSNKLELSNKQWKEALPTEVYHIARDKGTEKPFTGKYLNHREVGFYHCAACGYKLFQSDTKFESSCGWPSFFEPHSKGSLRYAKDTSLNRVRTEVLCGRCDAHLGHVFEDGPKPTGLRYCINSVILNFEKEE